MNTYDICLIIIVLLVGSFLIYKTIKSKRSYKSERDKRIMNLVPGDGHKTYELNMSTLDMDEVEAEDYTTKEGEKFKRIITKDNCLYCTALNEKNAIKKFSTMVPGKFEKA